MTFSLAKGGSVRRDVAGFTLTEMLVTTLILAMVSTLMATGIPVAIDTYQKVVKTSNAQLALSTTVSIVKNELGLATDVQVVGEDTDAKIYYYSLNEGCWISINNPDSAFDVGVKGLVKQYYKGLPTAETPVTALEKDGVGIPIVSNETITNDLKAVELKSASQLPDTKEIQVSIRVTDKADNNLANVGETQPYRILTRFKG